MSRSHLTVSREYDLPRSIVWDAFVDPDLVSGWLAPGIAAEVMAGISNAPFEILVATSEFGRLTFQLDELEGGTRTTSTRVTVTVAKSADARLASSAVAHWMTNLEQLESLLRGKPVIWEQWEHDWRPVLLDYLSNKRVTKPL